MSIPSEVITEIRALLDREKEHGTACFLLSTTARQGRRDALRVTGVFSHQDLRVVHAVVHDWSTAEAVVKQVDGVVPYIGLDCEMKEDFGGKSLLGLTSRIRQSEVLHLKPNDLTADGVLALLLCEFGNALIQKRILIIGVGNVGAKIAQRLVEIGCQAHCYRRNKQVAQWICQGINAVKPSFCAGNAEPVDSKQIQGTWDIVLVCTPGTIGFTFQDLAWVAPDGLVIDVGIGTLEPQALQGQHDGQTQVRFHRFDTASAILAHLKLALATRDQKTRMGRCEMDGIAFVSGGYIGKAGDVVVDNVNAPHFVLGQCDGKGGVTALTLEQKTHYESVLRRSPCCGIAKETELK